MIFVRNITERTFMDYEDYVKQIVDGSDVKLAALVSHDGDFLAYSCNSDCVCEGTFSVKNQKKMGRHVALMADHHRMLDDFPTDPQFIETHREGSTSVLIYLRNHYLFLTSNHRCGEIEKVVKNSTSLYNEEKLYATVY